MSTKNSNKESSKPLTDAAIRHMEPGDERSDVGSSRGLRISCSAKKKKTFFYRYRSPDDNRLLQVKLGTYPDMTLLDARKKHHELQLIRNVEEKCPKAFLAEEKEKLCAEKEAQRLKEEVEAYTIKDMVEDYLTGEIEDKVINNKVKKGGRKPKGQKECRRTLEVDVVKKFGKRAACRLGEQEIYDHIKKIMDERGVRVQAGRVLNELSLAYEYALVGNKLGSDFQNPAEKAKKQFVRLNKNKKGMFAPEARKTNFTDNQLKVFLKWLPDSGFSQAQRNILLFSLMTGCRTGEVCIAEWENVDLSKGTWRIADPKNKHPRDVQLTRQAIRFLKALKKENHHFPFESVRTRQPLPQKKLTETLWEMRNQEERKKKSKKDKKRVFSKKQLSPDSLGRWVPHDLRRTVRINLAKMGCPYEVCEAILGHHKTGVHAVYNQHKHEAECKKWLQKWCNYLDELHPLI